MNSFIKENLMEDDAKDLLQLGKITKPLKVQSLSFLVKFFSFALLLSFR